jgi:alpha-D-ribose 1-methylphosphonate 5-triphosphate synthase subunit PhnG
MSDPIGYYILAGIAPASAFLVALMATYAQRTPRTRHTNAELIQRRRAQIERNSARKTTTQQTRRTAK